MRRARPLLGTFVEIEVSGASGYDTDCAVAAAFDAVAEVHRLMSFHETDSDVSRLNREAGVRPVRVHDWTFQVLETAVGLYRQSGGCFDVTIAPALQAMGLLPPRKHKQPAASIARISDAISLLPDRKVCFQSTDVTIDLGGIAKGFAVDRAVDTLRDFGMASGMVNAGGDLRAFGKEARTVHVRDPRDPSRPICRIDVTNEALASTARRMGPSSGPVSAGSAVIDPATRRPAGPISGVTVRAPTCMIADALTKIVMIAGSDAAQLLTDYEASALMISADHDIHITSDWHHAVHLAA
ncbi:FAD:protein FMN transferase [Bradyrhizobium manausense]|uniref:FAD:protein FMN transferase n=1 Tax=Bradyrhizobium manausense TaxID=989370 RepID=UPI0020112014|nr:FAD:protein FMN transferase [Bradyrhizobium manausense]